MHKATEVKRERMYHVYVLQNNFGQIYIGYTQNLENRLKEHNSSTVKTTKSGKPWRIIYTENYKEKKFAEKRECYLKSHAGRIKIRSVMRGLPDTVFRKHPVLLQGSSWKRMPNFKRGPGWFLKTGRGARVGLRGTPGERIYPQGYHGFESHPLRFFYLKGFEADMSAAFQWQKKRMRQASEEERSDGGEGQRG